MSLGEPRRTSWRWAPRCSCRSSPLVSPLAGTVIDLTGSYQRVFFIGATVAVIALLGFGLLVREPRTGRLYEFSQIPLR